MGDATVHMTFFLLKEVSGAGLLSVNRGVMVGQCLRHELNHVQCFG